MKIKFQGTVDIKVSRMLLKAPIRNLQGRLRKTINQSGVNLRSEPFCLSEPRPWKQKARLAVLKRKSTSRAGRALSQQTNFVYIGRKNSPISNARMPAPRSFSASKFSCVCVYLDSGERLKTNGK